VRPVPALGVDSRKLSPPARPASGVVGIELRRVLGGDAVAFVLRHERNAHLAVALALRGLALAGKFALVSITKAG
jgi:hypothetical protein